MATASSVIVLLLRGINLGAHNRMSMAQLLDCATAAGIADAATVQQTGNLVGRHPGGAGTAAQALREQIAERLGLDVPVVGFAGGEFTAAVAALPFTEFEPKFMNLYFLQAEPEPAAVERLLAGDYGDDRVLAGERVLYARYASGLHTSKFVIGKVERALKMVATARNITTSLNLAQLVAEREAGAATVGGDRAR
ncbi:DUF1697 domain-containing protein [Micrococcales bacterium 31B]|nr:DUF1697 domain-containing protein [Micrococcales bacterium 31B]